MCRPRAAPARTTPQVQVEVLSHCTHSHSHRPTRPHPFAYPLARMRGTAERTRATIRSETECASRSRLGPACVAVPTRACHHACHIDPSAGATPRDRPCDRHTQSADADGTATTLALPRAPLLLASNIAYVDRAMTRPRPHNTSLAVQRLRSRPPTSVHHALVRHALRRQPPGGVRIIPSAVSAAGESAPTLPSGPRDHTRDQGGAHVVPPRPPRATTAGLQVHIPTSATASPYTLTLLHHLFR